MPGDNSRGGGEQLRSQKEGKKIGREVGLPN